MIGKSARTSLEPIGSVKVVGLRTKRRIVGRDYDPNGDIHRIRDVTSEHETSGRLFMD